MGLVLLLHHKVCAIPFDTCRLPLYSEYKICSHCVLGKQTYPSSHCALLASLPYRLFRILFEIALQISEKTLMLWVNWCLFYIPISCSLSRLIHIISGDSNQSTSL